METILEVLQNFGLSVAVIFALMWYIIYKDKSHKEESKAYTDTIQKNTDAMNEMRVVMERLCTVIGGENQ